MASKSDLGHHQSLNEGSSDINHRRSHGNPDGSALCVPEVDDEALARMLQQQFLEEHRSMESSERHIEAADMELARRIQDEENAHRGRVDVRLRRQTHAAGAASAEKEAGRGGTKKTKRHELAPRPGDTSEESLVENDLELALCIQELDQIGRGRRNELPPGVSNSLRRDVPEVRRTTLEGVDQQNRCQIRGDDGSGSQDSNCNRQKALSHPFEPPGLLTGAPVTDVPSQQQDTKRKKIRGILSSILGKGCSDRTNYASDVTSPGTEESFPTQLPSPAILSTRTTRPPGTPPRSVLETTKVKAREANALHTQRKSMGLPSSRTHRSSLCSGCGKPASSFLMAIDKKYHQECFKCIGCNLIIDSTGPFAYMTNEVGERHPLHRKCYSELYGVKCAVCRCSIPAGPDGKVSFVKHPFFDTEQMCPRHASNPGRRCTGCHRFEPEGQPFADLGDSSRCVCFSCCRTVVVDGNDAKPLWRKVIHFFEKKLRLPIWKDMREVPVLIVGFDALNVQLMNSGGAHGGSSQIMTRGLCLTEHQSGRKFKLSRLKFDKHNQSFEACDVEEKGFTFFQVPDANKANPDASVTAILCLSGLPGDLAASVLAHEATHAWIKLHPSFKIGCPIPPMVEEGVAQLVAMLFLTDGLEPASTETYGDEGPTDEKLRQYFKFSIETDDHEIYGEGYRKAAKAYSDIGIEALLSHVVLYKEFPLT